MDGAEGSGGAPDTAPRDPKRPRLCPVTLPEGTEDADLADSAAEFQRVRTNRVACLTFLVRLAQGIERRWDEEAHRLAGIALLRDCLLGLRESRHRDLQELSWLGEKIKDLDFPLKHFLVLFLPIERKYTRGLRDDEFLVTTADKAPGAVAPTRLPFVVVLDNLRSAFNVGAVFRTAECLGAARLHLCGYTATPAEAQTQRATMGTEAVVPWEAHDDIRVLLAKLREDGVAVIALETVPGGADLLHFRFPPPTTRCALVLGNERHGLEAPVLELCTHVVRIPCYGTKNSLNVGVAFGIAAYELVRQWRSGPDPPAPFDSAPVPSPVPDGTAP